MYPNPLSLYLLEHLMVRSVYWAGRRLLSSAVSRTVSRSRRNGAWSSAERRAMKPVR